MVFDRPAWQCTALQLPAAVPYIPHSSHTVFIPNFEYSAALSVACIDGCCLCDMLTPPQRAETAAGVEEQLHGAEQPTHPSALWWSLAAWPATRPSGRLCRRSHSRRACSWWCLSLGCAPTMASWWPGQALSGELQLFFVTYRLCSRKCCVGRARQQV